MIYIKYCKMQWYRTNIKYVFCCCHDRKDFEVSQLNNKIEDEQAISIQLQKKLKELQVTEI